MNFKKEMIVYNLEDKRSKKSIKKVTCPSCGNEQKTIVWKSINVTLEPKLRFLLFRAKINVLSCKCCNHKSFIKIPLLYHDQERRFCIQFYPFEFVEENDFLTKHSKDAKINYNNLTVTKKNSFSYMLEPHIVFEVNEMIKYIIFREQLFRKYNKN